MGKFIKTALVFMGGMATGAYCVTNAVLKSEPLTTALKDSVTKKTVEVLYGSKVEKSEVVNRTLERIDDIIFETRKDAEQTFDAMADTIQQYGLVSLADVYDIAGIGSATYAANKYGWRSLDGGKVVRCRDGYRIELPKPEELK